MAPVCFFRGWSAGQCDGALIRAHLIPRQLLKREFPHGVVLDGDRWRRLERNEDRYDLAHRTLRELVDDERSWVPCCGGAMGNAGHHGALDVARTLRVPRGRVPSWVESFAAELGLTWWLDREYGEREAVA